MYRKFYDLLLVLLLATVGGGVAIAFVEGEPIRTVLTLPLVLALPGYALTTAILPNRTLGFPERLAFSLGLSLAVGVLGGLALNLTPWGLQTNSWALLLSGFTIGAACIALLRRTGRADIRQMRFKLGIYQGLPLAVAVAVAGAALAVAINGAIRHPSQGFTQLWILPANGATTDVVQLGVSNMEMKAMTYRVQLMIGDMVVGDWEQVELQHGQNWTTEFALPVKGSGVEIVEAELYRLDAPETIYRRVKLWRNP
jgi:uncharacterized membrane protein